MLNGDKPHNLVMDSNEAKEENMYRSILDILTKKFESMDGDIHLEITSKGRFSRKLREVLAIETLQILRVERLSPDITGYYVENDRKEIIIVEIKKMEITIKNIIQANTYGEIFNASYCILISPKPLGREKRLFIKNKSLVSRGYRSKLIIALYEDSIIQQERDIKIEEEILRDLYYGDLPEPFKDHTPTFEVAKS